MARQWATLARTWLSMTRAPAMVGQRDEKDKPISALSLEATRHSAPATRRAVLTALAQAPAGTAPDPEKVLELLAWQAPGGSRALPVGGAAMLGVSDKIKAKGKEVASRLLEAAAEDIEYKDGQFRIVGTDRRASLWDVAEAAADPDLLPEGASVGLNEQYTRQPEAATFPNGCHLIEVEVDPDTGMVHIDRYVVVDDFGAVINPIRVDETL